MYSGSGIRKDNSNETSKGVEETKTAPTLKTILRQHSIQAGASYLLPENVYGKVEIESYFKLDYSYATVEFKIGLEQKYVLKNISSFLQALQKNERVRYGKKLDFYHNPEAFTVESRRIVEFLKQQNEDKKRQSRYHAYYVHSGGYERTMELDEVGIDRFFEATAGSSFTAEIRYHMATQYVVTNEERRPRLTLKTGGAGVFLILEELTVIRGSRYYYFCEDGRIYRSSRRLREQTGDIFDYLERQASREGYIAAAELAMFCRDLLPLLKETFEVSTEDFDESLYLPKKPEFELYLDKQEMDVTGARLLAVYGEEKYNVLTEAQPGEVREIAEETRVKSLVEPYFNDYSLDGTIFILSHDEDKLYQLLTGGLRRLSEFMTIYTTETFRNMKVTPPPNVTVGISLKSDLLELQLHTDEMSQEQLAFLLTKYRHRKKYIRLKNGDFLNLKNDGLRQLAEVSEDLQLTEADIRKGHVIVPKYRAMYLDASLRNGALISVEKNKEFKSMVRNMKTIEDSDYEAPVSLKPVMRRYQKSGFLWLKTLRESGFGGILADEMGLGKTLQVIALLLSEHEEAAAGEREWRRHLIVCPASLVYNWQREIARFAPKMPVVVVAGNAAQRQILVRESREGDILITSYDALKRDAECYKDCVFAVQVVDEAQYIKNSNTRAAKAAKMIRAAFKLALTGTPIENRLSELWSIFDFLMPGFLYSYSRFREDIESPIVLKTDEERMERLQKMIRPFVLRRLKRDVLTDLPEKLEENLYAKLEGEQSALYNAHVQKLKQMLEEKTDQEFRTQKIQILAEIMKLRQICCDPSLIYEHYTGGSAKAEMCIELIQNAVSGGHKVLLFSQFTTMLDRLAVQLKEAEIPYYMLTGTVKKEERIKMVESFDQDDVPVFCISLRAGGTGLNLTAADIVIHYDPWWNVAVQNQATDRAHRIGQEHVVTVYKLVSQGTIEEKIVAIQEKKQKLADQVLAGEGMDQASFTREEILQLIG